MVSRTKNAEKYKH